MSIYTSHENGKLNWKLIHSFIYINTCLKWYHILGISSLFFGEHHKYFYFSYLIFIFYSSASNRIIPARDHASIQLNLAEVDPVTGRMTDNVKIYAISGEIRRMVSWCYYMNISGYLQTSCPFLICSLSTLQGESDDCLLRLAKKDGLLPK